MPGWRKLQVVEIGRAFGKLPSELLRMDEAGYSPEVQLSVDDGWLAFVQEFERMRDATVMVPMKDRPKGEKPMVPAPKHTTAELKRALDIPVGEDSPSSLAALATTPLTWEPIDWGDESTAPIGVQT